MQSPLDQANSAPPGSAGLSGPTWLVTSGIAPARFDTARSLEMRGQSMAAAGREDAVALYTQHSSSTAASVPWTRSASGGGWRSHGEHQSRGLRTSPRPRQAATWSFRQPGSDGRVPQSLVAWRNPHKGPRPTCPRPPWVS